MSTEVIQIHTEFPDLGVIAKAARIIRQGGLVVFPTETVYGIAADFSNEKAMDRLRDLKNRENKPFSLLIPRKEAIFDYTSLNSPVLYKMIDQWWPGPLTVVVPKKHGEGTFGLRIPDHQVALRLIREANCAIAAPSANLAGNPPATNVEEVLRDLDGKVDLILDAGQSEIGSSSSVVDVSKENVSVLREGAISNQKIEEISQRKDILFVCTGNSCRSVMAEYLMKDKLKKRNHTHVRVASAGTSVFVQSTASEGAVEVLSEKGVQGASEHSSQPVNSVLLKKSDLIFCLTQSHRHYVLQCEPSVENRTYMLREFVKQPPSFQSELDIPDPMGMSLQSYRDCLAVIDEAVEKIADLV